MRLILCILAILTLPLSVSAVPASLGHSGRILESNGFPVSGSADLTFSLYDSAENGQPIWDETSSITFDNGFYSVVLGTDTNNPLTESYFDGSDLYLGVKLADNAEMVPRFRITSVPYAFRAKVSESVQLGDGTIVIDENGQWVGDPTGLQGEPGPQGLQGEPGPQGEQGLEGPPGESGIIGGSDKQLIFNNDGTADGAEVYYNNSTQNVGLGVTDPVDRLSVDGVLSMKEQSTSPSATSEFGKIYAKATQEVSVDEDTKLLIHSDTSNGSTTFTDSSASNHSITTYAGISHVDQGVVPKFGSSAIYFDGNGSQLSMETHSDWYFGTGPFTVDFWYYQPASSGGQHNSWVSTYPTYSNGWFIEEYPTGKYGYYSTTTSHISSSVNIIKDQWVHVALVREGSGSNQTHLYVNGQNIWSFTESGDWTSSNIGKLDIGTLYGSGNSTYSYHGYMDEVRISKGVARWTSNFTPNNSPYSGEADSDLFYMDSEGNEYLINLTPVQ